MVTSDPLDELALGAERVHHLREAAAAERLRRSSATRRALAGSLRRLADSLDPDRLDTGPFAPRPA